MNAAALYVDVVKNMAKAETPPPATPPLPKFTILHEDFPALPGTLQSSRSSSKSSPSSEPAVAEPAVVHVAASTDYSNANSTTPTLDGRRSNSNGSEELNSPKSECFPPNFYGCVNESMFDQQFLFVGVQQRAWARQKAMEARAHIGPPPGFQRVKYYGRLRTNRMGVPLGGVTFDTVTPPPPPASTAAARQSDQVLKDAYGLAGLADNLQAAQQNPRLIPQIFGHEVACLNVHTHCCACEANKLHAGFAGALHGGHCGPHEVQHDVPPYYRRPYGKALPQPKVEQMESELLFFFFYTYPNDLLQMLAAAELAERGWRFHMYERLWIRRQPDNPHYIVTRYQESGEYNYFNMMHWKIMPRHFELLPEQLEHTITKAELRDQYGYHPQMRWVLHSLLV
ncbi:hypothetical protein KR093_004571 [Drosophila rubida]|uniref:NOT2/NOT3/NOT5 C-terminal domain-containing protein n=1 Tax=Drosophila rubida TaxID=30044 RepID=A0AAD4PMR0_9MUSC|nr:hypothetical protein KR093_004571 [Drosophila rubida]